MISEGGKTQHIAITSSSTPTSHSALGLTSVDEHENLLYFFSIFLSTLLLLASYSVVQLRFLEDTLVIDSRPGLVESAILV